MSAYPILSIQGHFKHDKATRELTMVEAFNQYTIRKDKHDG